MDDIEEKRVYGRKAGRTEAFVACDLGVVAVDVADDRVGEFGIAHRCVPRDLAADGRVAVATADDVLLRGDGEFRETGFGPAVAVGFDGATLVAADEDRLAVREGEWRERGSLAGVNAIDGDLIATGGGVYRLDDPPVAAGLDAARDVSAAGRPLAATADGLYALGNGWTAALEGDFRVAAGDGARAHAATPDALYRRSEGEWGEVDLPVDEPVVDVAYGDCPYALTDAGTLLADAGEGWRSFPLGLDGARGLAIP